MFENQLGELSSVVKLPWQRNVCSHFPIKRNNEAMYSVSLYYCVHNNIAIY